MHYYMFIYYLSKLLITELINGPRGVLYFWKVFKGKYITQSPLK